MPRGTRLTPRVERIIGDVYTKHPELRNRSQQFHEQVYKRVHDEIDWADDGWPGPSVVKKRLAVLRERDRNRPPESTELDEMWSLCCLPKHPILPEALPLVMSIWEKCVMELGLGGHHSELWCLTVREALWIARLHKVLEFYHRKQVAHWEDPINADRKEEAIQSGDLPENYLDIKFEDILRDWAYTVASAEEYSEIEGVPFNEGEFDVHMTSSVFEYCGFRRDYFVQSIAQLYGIAPDMLSDPALSIGDIELAALKAFVKSESIQLLYIPSHKMDEVLPKVRRAFDDMAKIARGDSSVTIVTMVNKDASYESSGDWQGYKVDVENADDIKMWREFAVIATRMIEKRYGGTK